MKPATRLCLLLGIAAVLAMLPLPLGAERNAGDGRHSAVVADADAWPGWRGLAAEGRAPSDLPTTWNAIEGIRWKTAIPGRGHSSPIVFGDRVYVTTAYVTSAGVVVQDAFRLLTLALFLAVAAFALHMVISRCQPARSPMTAADLGYGSCTLAAVLVLGVIAYGGDALFDYARCNIRGWIASTTAAALCLGLVSASAGRQRLRWIVALSTVVFAVFVLAAFPSKGFAFRGGISSLRMQIAIAASVVPLVIGVAIACAGAIRATRTHRMLAAAGAILLAAGALLLLRHLLVFRDDSFPPITYVPNIHPWWLFAGAAAFAIAWVTRRLRGESLVTNVALVACCAAMLVLAGIVAIEQLAIRSPYLAYQIGTPSFEQQRGDVVVWIAAAAVLVSAFWRIATTRRTPVGARDARFSTPFAFVTLALAGVFFLHVNYLPAQSRLVRAIVALDRESGELEWTLEGLDAVQPSIDGRNSPATPTPVTDGRIVCAYFGTPGLMCGDTSGRLAWSREDLGYEGFYGVGFSPVLADGMLVIASEGPDGVAHVHSLDAATGATRWTQTFATTPTVTGNNRTPIVRQVDDRQVLILWGMQYVKGLALESGEPVWTYEHISDGDLVSSAISDQKRLYLSSKAGTIALEFASLFAGVHPVQWTNTARANCASPVLVNGMLFTVTDAGVATALHAGSGETLWRQRLPGEYFASLVASRDAVYFTNSDGLTTVVAAEPAFRIIARNDLGEPTTASMAAVRSELFIRASTAIYAIGRAHGS